MAVTPYVTTKALAFIRQRGGQATVFRQKPAGT